MDISRREFVSIATGAAALALASGCAAQSGGAGGGGKVVDPADSSGFAPLEEEWWHFRLDQESYPDTYFTFPVNEASIKR